MKDPLWRLLLLLVWNGTNFFCSFGGVEFPTITRKDRNKTNAVASTIHASLMVCKTTGDSALVSSSIESISERSELRRDFERLLERLLSGQGIDKSRPESKDARATQLSATNYARRVYSDESQWHTRAKIFMIFSLAWRDVLYHRRVYTACQHSHSSCLHWSNCIY